MSDDTNPYRSAESPILRRCRNWPWAILAIVAVVGSFLGYNYYWMMKRESYIFYAFKQFGCGPVSMTPGTAPWSIRILGARGYGVIHVAKDSAEDWTDRDWGVKEEVNHSFPEAQVYSMTFAELTAMWQEMRTQPGPWGSGEPDKTDNATP